MAVNNAAPLLKWAGKKTWLVERRLGALWVDYCASYPEGILVEPFVGSLAVAPGLNPRYAILNDNNKHLINLYRWVQAGLICRVEDEDIFVNKPAAFDTNRIRFNQLAASPSGWQTREAALLFLYLNYTCFNGLCRFNQSGEFNVGYGKYKHASERYAGVLARIPALQAAIQNWQFTAGDFADISLDPGDFVYCDPPYDDGFTGYSAGRFTWVDQVRLVSWLDGTDATVVVSNKATDRICALYEKHDYRLEFYDAPRSISCNGDRKPVREVLAIRQ